MSICRTRAPWSPRSPTGSACWRRPAPISPPSTACTRAEGVPPPRSSTSPRPRPPSTRSTRPGWGTGAGGSPSAAPGALGSGAASARDGAAPWHQTLMLLVDIDQQGPSVLPVHRLLAGVPAEVVLARLQEDFQIGPAASPSELEAQLEREPRQRVAFGLYGGGQTRLLVARDSQALRSRTGLDHTPLDVEVLHRTVLEGTLGLRDLEHQVA